MIKRQHITNYIKSVYRTVVQGTFTVVQGTFTVVQGTFTVVQGTFTVVQGTFIQWIRLVNINLNIEA